MLQNLKLGKQGMLMGSPQGSCVDSLFYAPLICHVPFEVKDNMLMVMGRFFVGGVE